jgi:acetoin utilization deacetylase AcuC-like enzyme
MERDDWFGWERREAPGRHARAAAGRPSRGPRRLHPQASRRRRGAIDSDTVVVEGTWELITAPPAAPSPSSTPLLTGEAPYAMSGMRPPGHHAEAGQAMGFCFFNSIAGRARPRRPRSTASSA